MSFAQPKGGQSGKEMKALRASSVGSTGAADGSSADGKISTGTIFNLAPATRGAPGVTAQPTVADPPPVWAQGPTEPAPSPLQADAADAHAGESRPTHTLGTGSSRVSFALVSACAQAGSASQLNWHFLSIVHTR